MYDYNDTDTLAAMQQSFAETAGVPPADVTLAITGGSVTLRFSVVDEGAEDNAQMSAALATTFGTAAQASIVLKAPVVATPNVALVTTHTVSRVPSSPPAAPGTVYMERVTTSFQLSGDVSSFDRDGFRAALLAVFTTALEVIYLPSSILTQFSSSPRLTHFNAVQGPSAGIRSPLSTPADIAAPCVLHRLPSPSLPQASTSKPPSTSAIGPRRRLRW